MDNDRISRFISEHKGMIIGGLIGLIIAVLFLAVGFFQTLLLFLFIAIGCYFGYKRENREKFIKFIEKLFPNGKDND